MPCRVKKHDGIIPAICIQVKAVACFRFEIVQAIRRDKSARFGIVVAAVQVVKPDGSIVIIPAVAEGVSKKHLAFRLIQQIPPRVATLLTNERAGCTFMMLQNESLVNPLKHRRSTESTVLLLGGSER